MNRNVELVMDRSGVLVVECFDTIEQGEERACEALRGSGATTPLRLLRAGVQVRSFEQLRDLGNEIGGSRAGRW